MHAADSDDRFPLIEILKDAAIGVDDATATSRFHAKKRGYVIDVDSTVPQALFSSPYERVDVDLAEAPRPRKRAATISRAVLTAQRAQPTPARVEAETHRFARVSSPYDLIEIASLQAPARPSINALTSGSFEAAWFASSDDVITDNEPEHTVTPATPHRWILAAMALGAFGVGIALATML